MKMIRVLGFECDRDLALKAIKFCSSSKDFRAPLADMVLLWYTLIAGPTFDLNPSSLQEIDSQAIIDKNVKKYENSSLFLILKSRFYRIAKHDLDFSLEVAEISVEKSIHIKELNM